MKRLIIVAALVVAASSTIGAWTADAGRPERSTIVVNYIMSDTDAPARAALAAAMGQVLDTGKMQIPNCTGTPVSMSDPPTKTLTCTMVENGTYTAGITGLSLDYFVTNIQCTEMQQGATPTGATFTVANFDWTCNVNIASSPQLFVDKLVSGGTAAPGDFTIQILDTSNNVLRTLSDPSTDACSPTDLVGTKCAETKLPPGTYQLNESVIASSYEFQSVVCQDEGPTQPPPAPRTQTGTSLSFTFSHSNNDRTKTLCQVANLYQTREIRIDLVIVNDDGGTATGADFTLEVFQGGTLVASGKDPELGTGNAAFVATLPYGNYTVGVSGPASYTTSVVVTPTGVAAKPFGPEGNATLSRTQNAAAVVTADDPRQTPTTSTTTTTTTSTSTTTTTPTSTTTTTLAPTTAAPTTQQTTTTFDPASAAPVLPATGSSSPWPTLLAAFGALLIGAGSVLLARRT